MSSVIDEQVAHRVRSETFLLKFFVLGRLATWRNARILPMISEAKRGKHERFRRIQDIFAFP
jgi:hypothetical protein